MHVLQGFLSKLETVPSTLVSVIALSPLFFDATASLMSTPEKSTTMLNRGMPSLSDKAIHPVVQVLNFSLPLAVIAFRVI